MQNRQYLYLFIPLFFLLTLSNAFAYTQFSTNPDFTNDISGVYFYDFGNNSLIESYNETCYGHSGCLFMESNTSNYKQVYIVATLPANKEGMVSFDYYMNVTQSNYPTIETYYLSGASQVFVNYSTNLDPTISQWNNVTFRFNQASIARNMTILLTFNPDSPATLIAMNKFYFFTFDDDQTSLVSISQASLASMCNSTTASTPDITDLVGCDYGTYGMSDLGKSLNGSYTQFQLFEWETGTFCVAYQYGNTVSSRYAFPYCVGSKGGGTNTGTGAIHTKDMTIIQGADDAIGGDFTLYINKFTSASSFQCSMPTKDSPSNYVSNSFNNSIYGGYAIVGISSNWTNCAKAFKTNLSNVNFTGANWFIGSTGASSGGINSSVTWSYFSQTCTPSQSCNSGSEYYINGDCSQTLIKTCQCGCSADLVNCVGEVNYTVPATYCDDTDTLGKRYITYINNSDCSISTYLGECQSNEFCVFHGSTYSIECFNNETGNHDYCINATGSLIVNCTGIALPLLCTDESGNWIDCPVQSFWTNTFGYLSLMFGGMFGTSNLTFSEAGFSIFLSLMFAFIALYFEKKSKNSGNFAVMAFIGTFLICTIMAGNAWLYGIFAVIVILSAGIATGSLKKLVGGG